MSDSWTCPDCDRSFANTHQWHSCVRLALDDHLADKTEHAIELFRGVESRLRSHGGFRLHPQKTRVGFIARMTFASVQLQQRWIVLSLVVTEPIDDDRIRRIEVYGPTAFVHQLRISALDEIDPDVDTWLASALERGSESTDTSSVPAPVVGRVLERLVIPFASRVVRFGTSPALRVPRYAAALLDVHPEVTARLLGQSLRGRLCRDHERRDVLVLDVPLGQLGLGADDPVDVSLTPAW